MDGSAGLDEKMSIIETNICLYCKSRFIPKRNTKGLFCKRDCFNFHWSKNKINKYECNHCNKVFTRYKTHYPDRKNKYCSKECSDKAKIQEFDPTVFRFDIKKYSYFKPKNSLGDYSKFRKVRKSKYEVDHEFFKQGVINEETAYLLGVLITDGYVFYDYKSHVLLKQMDKTILEIMKKILKSSHPIQTYKNDAPRVCISGRRLAHDLDALGCGQNKSYTVTFPQIKKELQKHFIRGIFDGDGSWNKRKNRREVNLKFHGNDRLLFGIYDTIRTHLNIHPQSLEYPIDTNKNYKMKTYAVLKYNTNSSRAISDWIYIDAKFFGEKKYSSIYGSILP
nr:LAGLIDADG family homing endonuclease [Chengkuizengella sediminis]